MRTLSIVGVSIGQAISTLDILCGLIRVIQLATLISILEFTKYKGQVDSLA